VREAAVDARLQNVIYRQTQLENLHKALLDNVDRIERAIKDETGHSETEIGVEYVLALKSVMQYHELLDESVALRQE
jgi:molecular chaperone GrpE (heat shock protein)